jgi:NADPH:quinone reductase-like Zn-dependent oxidoreductase
MKAAIRLNYGDTRAIRVSSWPRPIPKPHEVLIKVIATTVNRTDCGVLGGKPYIFRFFVGWPSPRFPVLGTDFAGVVEEIGIEVSRFKLGDRVWGFDDNGLPTHAEYMVYGENKNILLIPEGVSFAQAAASAEAAHYAVNFLRHAQLPAQAEVLVNGGTGGIGSALIQLLKAKGAKVTATAPREHLETVFTLGADRVWDFERESFLNLEEKFDVIFDAVGKSSFGKCKKLLKPNGQYLSSELGEGIENLYLPLVTKLQGGKRVKFPIPMDIKGSMKVIQEMLETGTFTPLIDKEYPLDDVASAYEYVCSGQKIGNVILKCV